MPDIVIFPPDFPCRRMILSCPRTVRTPAAMHIPASSNPIERMLPNFISSPRDDDHIPAEVLRLRLRNHLPHDAPRDVGEAKVAAGVAERELLVVEPHQMQDRGMKVVDV